MSRADAPFGRAGGGGEDGTQLTGRRRAHHHGTQMTGPRVDGTQMTGHGNGTQMTGPQLFGRGRSCGSLARPYHDRQPPFGGGDRSFERTLVHDAISPPSFERSSGRLEWESRTLSHSISLRRGVRHALRKEEFDRCKRLLIRKQPGRTLHLGRTFSRPANEARTSSANVSTFESDTFAPSVRRDRDMRTYSASRSNPLGADAHSFES